jgi:hypothetical protein
VRLWDPAGGRFPPAAEQRIEAAGKERLNNDKAFLAHELWIAPWVDVILTLPDLRDSNPGGGRLGSAGSAAAAPHASAGARL